jgi:hypothetical protein
MVIRPKIYYGPHYLTLLVAMAECKNCHMKFSTKGKIITDNTPDYVVVTHPHHGTDGMVFCGRACMFKFFAYELARAIVDLAKV